MPVSNPYPPGLPRPVDRKRYELNFGGTAIAYGGTYANAFKIQGTQAAAAYSAGDTSLFSSFTSAATIGLQTAAGILTTDGGTGAGSDTYIQPPFALNPEFEAVVKTSSTLTTQQIVVGLFNSFNTFGCNAYFAFDSAVDATHWGAAWNGFDSGGTNHQASNTALAAIATSTIYRIKIVVDSVAKTITWYLNGTPVWSQDISAVDPTKGATGFAAFVQGTTTNTSRALLLSRVYMEHD